MPHWLIFVAIPLALTAAIFVVIFTIPRSVKTDRALSRVRERQQKVGQDLAANVDKAADLEIRKDLELRLMPARLAALDQMLSDENLTAVSASPLYREQLLAMRRAAQDEVDALPGELTILARLRGVRRTMEGRLSAHLDKLRRLTPVPGPAVAEKD